MDIIREIEEVVFHGEDEERVVSLVAEALEQGIAAEVILQQALTTAMHELGEAWNRGEVFIPEVIAAANLFQRAADRLEPHLLAGGGEEKLGTVVLGTVEGDLHNLGKNLVAVMLRTGGFNVVDLGVNVPVTRFIAEAERHAAQIIGMSALLTTTMMKQQELIKVLTEQGLRERFKVMVGGAPITEKWASDIGADGFARNAGEAVDIAKKLIGS